MVTTQTLDDEGGYLTSTTLYDALLRVRQTQDPTPQGGILVTDHFYNSDGWEWKTNTNWWDSTASPGSSILTIPDSQVPDQTVTAYDGLGRPTVVTSYDDSAVKSTAYTAYYGDRVTTVPPTGGTPTSTVTDALGRTTELDSYTSAAGRDHLHLRRRDHSLGHRRHHAGHRLLLRPPRLAVGHHGRRHRRGLVQRLQPARRGDQHHRPQLRHHHQDLRPQRQRDPAPPTPTGTPSPTPTTR